MLQYIMEQTKLHRIQVKLNNTEQWYAVMRECRAWFGKNWKSQGRVKRKLQENGRFRVLGAKPTVDVWFEVPDLRFATWISVKHSLQVAAGDKLKPGK